MSDLTQKHCQPCEGGVEPLRRDDARAYMDAIPEWSLSEDATAIERTFSLKHFKETMFLANGIAAIAEREGHHPDMTVTYNTLTVRISTHAIGGLSENDFILAAKIDSLIAA